MTDNYAKDCGCGQRNCNKGWLTYNGSEYPCDGPKKLPASSLTNEMTAALKALDALDVAFANNFGTEGLEASECIQQAMSMIDRVEEVANGIPDDRLPKTMPASFWITNDRRVASQHCWVVVASTRQGTYSHNVHFSDKAEAENLLDQCRSTGRINLLHWHSCEMQG